MNSVCVCGGVVKGTNRKRKSGVGKSVNVNRVCNRNCKRVNAGKIVTCKMNQT